jgi:hypothetical protein
VSGAVLTTVVALLSAGAIVWLGRHDLSRPAVAFGAPWFGAVALAQLRLTELERPWSTGFTLAVLGGGLAFVVAATLAGGTAPARGALTVERRSVRQRRLVIAAILLFAAGILGAAYKARELGAIPLFADNPDAVRGRAFQEPGGALPAWSSALTNGFYLSLWCALAALWAGGPDSSRARSAGLWLLAAAALVGVSLEASRNLVLFAVAVPAIAAYILAPRPRAGVRWGWIVAAACVVAVGVGGLFVLRVMRADGGAATYVQREIERQPVVLRPLVPVYVNTVFPLEAARRLHRAVPARLSYGLGANSLTSLPRMLFPEGKPPYGETVTALMTTDEPEQLSWAVASYQGRLLADLGWQGVLLGSALLGLAFGALHRWSRARTGFLPLAVIAYVAYYSAFMVYDNLLSFTVIAVFDLAVIAVLAATARGSTLVPAA